jgi:hypothetical protein
MKRLITFACGLALTGACSGTPAVQGSSNLAATTPASSAADGKAAPSPSGAPAGTPVSAESPAGTPVATSGAAAATTPAPAAPVESAYREVTLPTGTVLPIDLETAVGSDTSRVEEAVSGRLRRAISLSGVEVLPAGTIVSGHVTAAQRPGKVKGRGMIAMRFTQIDPPGAGGRTAMSTATISRLAPATKKNDAVKIGAPAAAGAVIGGILGGKGGAGKGAIIGGGAGTGYVLATRGKDVHVARGADLAVKLTAPLTLRVAMR